MTPRRTTILKAVVSLVLLLLIFSRFDPAEMWSTIRTARLQPMMIGVLISPLILLLKIIKWQALVKQLASVSWFESGLSLMAGLGIGLMTPGRVGELTRVSYLPVAEKARFVGLVAVDRLLDLVAVMAAGALTIGLAFSFELAAGLFIAVALGLILLIVPGLPHRLVGWLARRSFVPAKSQLRKVEQGLFVLNTRVLLTVLFLSIAALLLAIYQFYWLLLSLGVDAPLASAVSFPILTVASVIPITISGFGTREGAAVLILSQYRIPAAVAINATLLSFALNTLVPGVVGLLLAPLGRSKRQPSLK